MCSAYRDNEECKKFIKLSEKLNYTGDADKEGRFEEWKQKFIKCFHKKRLKYDKIMKLALKTSERNHTYCTKCSELVYKNIESHESDPKRENLSIEDLCKPTTISASASGDNKKEAQYFFTIKTVDFLLDTFKRLKYKRIICIGSPTIHEAIQNQSEPLQMHPLATAESRVTSDLTMKTEADHQDHQLGRHLGCLSAMHSEHFRVILFIRMEVIFH